MRPSTPLLLLLCAAVLLAACCVVPATAGASSSWTPPPLNGVQYVTVTTDGGKSWQVKLNQASGMADHRYKVPLTTKSQFRIASNSKFFVAVALYQLQELGKLNVSAPVTDLFDATDYAKFGRPNATTWCPPLVTDPTRCATPSVAQLLSMSSGLVGVDNCLLALQTLDPAAQARLAPVCQRGWGDYPAIGMYGGNKAYYFSRVFDAPLLFAPGTQYSYANTGFVLAAYLVEKLSGLSYADYLAVRVLGPAGLNDTYYDPFDGQFALHPGLAGEFSEWLSGETGARLGLGGCPSHMSPGTFAGAAGVRGSVVDFHAWWHAVMRPDWTVAPGLGLSAASMRALLSPHIAVGDGTYFAQGMQVTPNPKDPSAFPVIVSYCGASFCSFTCNMLATAPGGQVQEMVSAWTNHEYYNISAARYNEAQHANDYAVPLSPLADPENPWVATAPQGIGFGMYRRGLKFMGALAQQLLSKYRPTALLGDDEVGRLAAKLAAKAGTAMVAAAAPQQI